MTRRGQESPDEYRAKLRAEMAKRQDVAVCRQCGYAMVYRAWPTPEWGPTLDLDAFLEGLAELAHEYEGRVTVYGGWILAPDPHTQVHRDPENVPVQVWRANDRRLVATVETAGRDVARVIQEHACQPHASTN
jgi:hypothetical protein